MFKSIFAMVGFDLSYAEKWWTIYLPHTCESRYLLYLWYPDQNLRIIPTPLSPLSASYRDRLNALSKPLSKIFLSCQLFGLGPYHFWFRGIQKSPNRDFPGGPGARTLHFLYREPRFGPGQGSRSHMPQLRVCVSQLRPGAVKYIFKKY